MKNLLHLYHLYLHLPLTLRLPLTLFVKKKLLLIEDSDEDAQIAIASLNEAGEEFDYTRVNSLSEALWELEAAPKDTYSKIYIDLGLKEVMGRTNQVLSILANRVGGKENIIAVGSSSDKSFAQTVTSLGSKYITKQEVIDTNTLATWVFDLQQKDRDRSVARHKAIATVEAKIAKVDHRVDQLQSQINFNKERIDLLLETDKRDDEQLNQKVNTLEATVAQLTSTVNLINASIQQSQAKGLALFQGKIDLTTGLLIGMIIAVVTKLLDLLIKK